MMKGVILAGGTGTRLLPLTQTVNKHLLTVHDRPMIHFSIATLVGAGIREVTVVTDPQHAGAFASALGDGSGLGLSRLELAFQAEPRGIADALRHAEEFAAGDRVCVILGDNLLERGITDHVQAFERQPSGARLLLKETADPRRFGVASFEHGVGSRLTGIVEKPAVAPSRFAVVGVYMYDPDVFDIVRTLRPSARGELEITDVNNTYIARGDAEYGVVEGWWTDAGTHESLRRAAQLVAGAGPRRP
jgi:glucose-1-phosphate thymidylyltransferase